MNILITGGTGTIGRPLVASLLSHGHTVYVLTRRGASHKEEDNLYYVHWNPQTGLMDYALLDKIDILIHLAGATIMRRWTKKYKKELYASRVYTMNWLYAIWKNFNPPKQVISISGLGYYDDHGEQWITEDTPPGNPDTNFLARLAIGWENAALQWKKRNVPVTILRTGIVLSETGGAFPLMFLMARFRLLAVIGNPSAYYSWIHISDLVNLFKMAITGELPADVYIATTENPVTQEHFVETLYKFARRRPLIKRIPLSFVQPIAGEVVKYLTFSLRARPQRLIDIGYKFQYPVLESAVKDLVRKL